MVRPRRAKASLWLALIGGAGAVGATALAAQPPEAVIAPLVEITDMSGLSVSPDGRTLLFRTEQASVGEDSYRLSWHALDLASGTIRFSFEGGRPIYVDPGAVASETPVWAPDGRQVLVRAFLEGGIGIRSLDVDSGASRWAVFGDADVEGVRAGRDGRSLLYRVGPTRAEIARAEQGEADRGVLVDARVDLAQSLFRGGSVNGRAATQRLVGYWTVRAGLLWQQPRQERRLNLQTGEDVAVGPPVAPRAFAPPEAILRAVAAEGEQASARRTGRDEGVIETRDGEGQVRACRHSECRRPADFLAWRPGARQLVFAASDRHRRQSLYLWDLPADAVRLIASGEGLLSGDRRGSEPCAISTEALFCIAASSAGPPRLERIGLATGERRVLFDPNGTLRRRASAVARPLSWRSSEGDLAHGVLLLPPGDERRPRPLFLTYYRCAGYLRGGEGDEWPVQALVDAGFAVACVNAAVHNRGEGAQADYEAALASVRTIVARLAAEGIIDRRRVGMGGFSFGSEAAMWIAMNSDLLQALSIASTQTEPAGYWMGAVRGSDRPGVVRQVWGLGAPGETREAWWRLSPALNVERLRAPILFQLPEQEARKIPELYARLTMSPTPTELYAFPEEGHVKVRPRHRSAVYRRNLDWFRYWLQGHVDPDPAKADQYRRWSALGARWRSEVSGPTSAAKAPSPQAR